MPRAGVRATRLRLFALAAVVTSIGAFSLVVLGLRGRELADFAADHGGLEIPLLAAGIVVLTVALVPAGLLAAAAGYSVGTALGFPIALVALVVGGTIAAALARAIGTPTAASALGERVARATRWLESRPFRSVTVARLAPGMPFNATSYVCGLTSIPLWVVAGGTALGFAPRAFAYTALGGSLTDLGAPEAKAALVVSVLILLTLLLVSRVPLAGGRHG